MKKKLLCLSILLVLPTSLGAQVFTPTPIPTMSMPGLGTYIPTVENGGLPDNSKIVQAPIATPIVNMRYTPSKARTRENLAAFVSRSRSVDPVGATQMEKLFASTDVMGQINQAVRSVGLRTDNVADAYAVWWISSWKAVNQKDIGDSTAMSHAVKKQVENALSATPEFASATDVSKQEMAESILIQAAMIDAHVDLAKDNPSQQAALAKAVNQGAKQMNLDLTKLDLTEQGFVPRSGGRSDASDAVEGVKPGEAGTALAANNPANDNAAGKVPSGTDQSDASKSDTGKLALYGVGGAALLAGVFALGKSFGGKG